MRLIIGAPFDLGVTLSLRNDVFADAAKTDEFRVRCESLFASPLQICAQAGKNADNQLNDFSIQPYGVHNPYGFGLRLKIEPGPFTALWRENARSFWRRNEADLTNEFGSGVYRETAQALESVSVTQISLFAFALGLCYVRLHVDLPASISAAGVRAIFKAYEFGGYGDLLPGEKTANAILAEWRDAVRRIFGDQSQIAAITKRDLEQGHVEIAGFQAIFLLPGEMTDPSSVKPLFRDGDAVATINYGELKLYVSWYIALAEGVPGFEYDYNRLLYIIMCHHLSWEACRVYQNLFTEKVRLSIIASIEQTEGALSRRQLNRIRQFAAYVLSVTTISNLSEYSGDIDLAAQFDRYANIARRHEHISLSAASLAQVEEDMVVTEERRNSRGVNLTLLALTVFSLVGVTAAVVDAWQDGINLFEEATTLMAVIIAPSLIAMLVILATRLSRK
jgi:hypothetical protein